MDFSLIRKLRKEKNYTLANMSEKTGYAPGFLSQLERGLRKPSLEALRKISEALDEPLISFFEDPASKETANDKGLTKPYYLIRKEKRKKVFFHDINVEYELITPYFGKGKNVPSIHGFFSKIEPGHWSAEKMVSHNFEETMYVVKGKITAFLGDKLIEFEEGDSLYLNINVPHILLNKGTEEAVVISFANAPYTSAPHADPHKKNEFSACSI